MKQAKATYAFTARSDTEISFAVGDVLEILEEDPSGWGKGRTSEYKEGYFPLAYVQIEDFSDSDSDSDEVANKKQPASQLCIAIYDFSALSDTQLSFAKGDVISINKKGSENDWWEGTMEKTQQKGLFPSNYVKMQDQHDAQIIQTQTQVPNGANQPTNTFKEPVQQPQNGNKESVEQTKQHKTPEANTSDFRIDDSIESDFKQHVPLSSLPPTSTSANARLTNSSADFSTNLSPLDVSAPFEIPTGNHRGGYAALSPISPNLSAFAYDSPDMARRRHSMNLSAAAPLALSAFSGEFTRDFDALCLMYPFVPSSVSQSAPPTQALVTPTKLPTSASQPVFVSPPSTPADVVSQPVSQPISIPIAHQSQPRPQSAPFASLSTRHVPSSGRQSTPPHPVSTHTPPQPSICSASQPSIPTSHSLSTPPKAVASKPPLPSSSPDRKEGYSNRNVVSAIASTHSASGAHANVNTHAGSATSVSPSVNGIAAKGLNRTQSRYTIKNPSTRRDPNANTLGPGGSKRKVKLEGSLVLAKRPNSTITHSNAALDQLHESQPNGEAKKQTLPAEPSQPQQYDMEDLKRILQQELELRVHLESVVHDAHGKMHSAAQYIKDLKAELFQAHMDISQLRVTNRQLNEQLDKYQLVTRVTVATQTERDENIDKIRVLTEEIHDLESNVEYLNEQILTLKSKNVDRSPRNADRSPRGVRGMHEANGEKIVALRSDTLVDYAAVKQQFARVRECMALEQEIKDRLILEKAQTQEKLLKTEQNGKQIRRKLLTELQLKSDLNVRNQHIELQMQRLKEELATYKQLNPASV